MKGLEAKSANTADVRADAEAALDLMREEDLALGRSLEPWHSTRAALRAGIAAIERLEPPAAVCDYVPPDKELIDATIEMGRLYAGLPAADELRPVLREAITALVYPRLRHVAVAASGTDAT